MLVLTRRIGEEIVIGSDIRVAVLRVSGRRIHLGITAPSSVGVMRRDLLATGPEPTTSPTSARNRK
jgi:carbon storage regulator